MPAGWGSPRPGLASRLNALPAMWIGICFASATLTFRMAEVGSMWHTRAFAWAGRAG